MTNITFVKPAHHYDPCIDEMAYQAKSQMSGEVIEEFELLEMAIDFADEGAFIRQVFEDGTTKEYPRRYVVDSSGDCVYAKSDWSELTSVEIREALEERKKQLSRQEGYIGIGKNGIKIYSTALRNE